jgi:hypothetical protein
VNEVCHSRRKSRRIVVLLKSDEDGHFLIPPFIDMPSSKPQTLQRQVLAMMARVVPIDQFQYIELLNCLAFEQGGGVGKLLEPSGRTW